MTNDPQDLQPEFGDDPVEVSDTNGELIFGDEHPEAETPATEPVTENPPVDAEPQSDESSIDEDNTPKVVSMVDQPAPVCPNVTLKYPVYTAVSKSQKDQFPLKMVAKRATRLTPVINSWDFKEEDAKDQPLNDYMDNWSYAVSAQTTASYHKDSSFFEPRIDDPATHWEQELEKDGRDFTFRQAGMKAAETDRLLSGELARDRISMLLGLGVSNRVVLVHSGFNVTLGTRSDGDLLNLEIAMGYDSGKAGYETGGIIFENSQFGTNRHLIEFILEGVRNTNIKGWKDIDLTDYIRVTDIPLLYNAMAAALYPQGYLLELPCSDNPKRCKHVERVNININRLFWFNKKGLSSEQLDMISKTTHLYDPEEITKYQSLGGNKFTKRVFINDSICLVLKVPTLKEYFTAGEEFVNAATLAIESVLGGREETEERKRDYVASQMKLSSIREYAHWIEELIIEKHDHVKNRDSIAEVLSIMSSEEDLVQKTLEAVQTFIEESTVGLIAIPNFSCPACHADYATPESLMHPELVPINPQQLFFELKGRRLLRRSQMQTG